MDNKLKALCEELTNEIKNSYEDSVSIEQAEKLAARFLHAQLIISGELSKKDLDSRMKKSGVKVIRAAIYLEEAKKTEKKPSDVMLEALVNSNDLVHSEQSRLDEAEVSRDELHNYLNIFKECHIYFRAIGRGRFE